MGNYDLYGNSYRTRREAENAELAQCAEIDARHAQGEVENIKHEQEMNQYYVHERISYLEQRIEALEKLLLNSEQNPEWSVATEADSSTDDGNQISLNPKHKE